MIQIACNSSHYLELCHLRLTAVSCQFGNGYAFVWICCKIVSNIYNSRSEFEKFLDKIWKTSAKHKHLRVQSMWQCPLMLQTCIWCCFFFARSHATWSGFFYWISASGSNYPYSINNLHNIKSINEDCSMFTELDNRRIILQTKTNAHREKEKRRKKPIRQVEYVFWTAQDRLINISCAFFFPAVVVAVTAAGRRSFLSHPI